MVSPSFSSSPTAPMQPIPRWKDLPPARASTSYLVSPAILAFNTMPVTHSVTVADCGRRARRSCAEQHRYAGADERDSPDAAEVEPGAAQNGQPEHLVHEQRDRAACHDHRSDVDDEGEQAR